MSALVPKVTRELTKMKRTLRTVFNLDNLRPGQAEVIRSVLEGENTLAKNKEKLERMMAYGQSAMCRWRLLHDYFDEEMEKERCGACDNCVHPLVEQILTTQRSAPVTQINGHA